MTNRVDPDQLADLELHCLQRQGISRFSRTMVNQYLDPSNTKPYTVITLSNGIDRPLLKVWGV